MSPQATERGEEEVAVRRTDGEGGGTVDSPKAKTEGLTRECSHFSFNSENVGGDAHIAPPSTEVFSYVARADTPRVLAPLRFAGVWASAPTN